MKGKLVCLFLSILFLYNILNLLGEISIISEVSDKEKSVEIDLSNQSQSDFLHYSKKIKISENLTNSENFIQNTNNSSICKYPEYNFTTEEEAKIWNYKPYSKCSTESNDSILIEDEKLIVTCASENLPEFYDFLLNQERLGGSRKIVGKWTQSPPDLKSKNFIFVKCQEKSIYSFVFLRFSQPVSNKAKENAQIFKSLHNISQEHRTSVLLLTFDSLSRGSTYRNLKKTIKLLNSKSSGFNSYDFLNPALPEIHTQDNMAQILYGESKKSVQAKLGTRFPALNSKLHLEYQQNSIWSHYSRLGYVTMFLHDTVWDYLTYLTGGTILCDHVFANYWKVVWSVYGFHDHQEGARCIGNQHSHNISFGYTFKFFETYPENNKFSYVHLDAAHETNGNIQNVDEDLKDFLENLISLFNKRNERFTIFLIGDHGQRRREMQFDIRNSYEGKQSLSFILTSKNFGNNETNNILLHNKENLFSRYDLHLSLKDLSYYAYLELSDEDYKELQKSYEVNDVKSLFREKTSSFRTCKDLGVSFELCPCNDFIRAGSSSDIKLLEEGFLPMIFQLFYIKNAYQMIGQNDSEITDYQKFTSSLIDDGFEVLYKISLKFDDDETAEINIRGCTENKIKETKNVLTGKLFESINYVYDGTKMFYQIFEINGFVFTKDKPNK